MSWRSCKAHTFIESVRATPDGQVFRVRQCWRCDEISADPVVRDPWNDPLQAPNPLRHRDERRER